MKNDGDDDAGSYCDDGCNLPWDDAGVVQQQALLPISDELLCCDWLAVAAEPAVVFTRAKQTKIFYAWQRKLPGSRRRNSWAEKC